MIKNNLIQYLFALLLLASAALMSCKDNNNTPTYGKVNIEFEQVWDSTDLEFQLDTNFVNSQTHDTVNASEFKFYISNIILIKPDGSEWKEENSYHLIDPENNVITIENIPIAEYSSMKIMLGIDSSHNASLSNIGDLNPSNGMFWNDSNGYIFLKTSGNYANKSKGQFNYKLGIRNSGISLNFPFPELLKIKPIALPEIHLKSEISSIWGNSVFLKNLESIQTINSTSENMLKQFSESFDLEHIHQ